MAMFHVLATVDAQEYAQLKILNKAQLRQIEDLEQKLEDSRRKMRYLEHQFAIVKGKLGFNPGLHDVLIQITEYRQFSDLP